jgi:phosphopantothenoylcysteine decarboxylase / phosphopantothenate---cysteine ligase
MASLQEKNILLGISGGIAAYKAPDLVRRLQDQGAHVRVVLTEHAAAFVTPLTLQAVSKFPVAMNVVDPASEHAMGHIELAKWADLCLIAPASANTIAKITYGLADDLLTTVLLATAAPIVVCPAMNQQMYHQAITQQNLKLLSQRGFEILGPASGAQACGDVGLGRMLEPKDIVHSLSQQIPQPCLAEYRIIITAGATQEAIDPVRYLSNSSSGKMGYALAAKAQQFGAQVQLVTGNTHLQPPAGVEVIAVTTALEMYQAVMSRINHCDIFIGCAAVSDYRIAQPALHKIKKKNATLTLNLIKNPDIIAAVAQHSPRPFTIGFAAETEQLEQYALEKLTLKNLDMIAANDVSQPEQVFNHDENRLHIFWPDGQHRTKRQPKTKLAEELLTLIATRIKIHETTPEY